MLRLTHSDATLHQALDEILRNWDETQLGWRDQARQEFEKDYFDELRPAVRTACSAMKDIYALLRQIQRECS